MFGGLAINLPTSSPHFLKPNWGPQPANQLKTNHFIHLCLRNVLGTPTHTKYVLCVPVWYVQYSIALCLFKDPFCSVTFNVQYLPQCWQYVIQTLVTNVPLSAKSVQCSAYRVQKKESSHCDWTQMFSLKIVRNQLPSFLGIFSDCYRCVTIFSTAGALVVVTV